MWVGVALIYMLIIVQPWQLVRRTNTVAETRSDSLRVLSWNLLSVNRSYQQILQLIAETEPDVLIMIEVRPGLLEELPEISEQFPIALAQPSWGGAGIAAFSRVQGTRLRFQDFDFSKQPAIVAEIPGRHGGSTLQLVGLHTLSPLPTHRAAVRDRQFAALQRWAEKQNGPICVCGDFNTTPWTAPFRSMCEIGFVDSRLGAENGPSWPARLGVLGIPIDHALSKGECTITERRVLNTAPGSDHRPLLFTVHF